MSHSSSLIHPSAVVAVGATLGNNVRIGAFCVVDEHVVLGDDVELVSHVSLTGRTHLGKGCKIYPFTSLGHVPQDLKFKGEPARLEIGEYTTIREHVTMNIGTEGGGMLTSVGSHCLFMVGTHVAHDCRVGNHVILANNATLAGHVHVGDHAVIGGLAAVHQFVRIGNHAMIGGLSGVEHDVIPYGTVMGERASLAGLNLVGLKRRNFSRETIHALRHVYKMVFNETEGVLEQRLHKAREEFNRVPEVLEVIDFIEQGGTRSLCVPARHD
jgi:UDP-N-acetylglucosamine acyltransferase